MLNVIKFDVNSTTGSNLRNILQLTDKNEIDELVPNDANNINYCPVPDEEAWRIPIMMDIINSRHNEQIIEGFSESELDDILDFVCTS